MLQNKRSQVTRQSTTSSQSLVHFQIARTMSRFARKLILREIKNVKSHRNASCSATGKSDNFLIKSTLPDFPEPNTRFIERMWKHLDGYKNHVALVSLKTSLLSCFKAVKAY